MIKDINIRFNLDKPEQKKAWDYMQNMNRAVEKSYSKVIIKSIIRYFEGEKTEEGTEVSEAFWERLRVELKNLMQEHSIMSASEAMPELAEKEEKLLPEISDDVMDALDDLF